MAKCYKERSMCKMCKVWFTVDKNRWIENKWPKSYCDDCCKKYFKKDQEKD